MVPGIAFLDASTGFRSIGLDDLRDDFAYYCTAWMDAHLNLEMVKGVGGQGKHGFAVRTRAACSQRCCEESPRALVQRVRVGDRRAR
eukprot:CAMPEP_0203957980 /NCGR_PEP_ID=MMETSP0359-20131031/89626_1 /ASSEMBLY_ACC=CAM_ASM_000338 /TAXON_ID=268821 /ORGANISM="Scrippsiella Hangoei, Strain SHTV-5" /LENGTH=86 /DNA_ID=CAMNT_0050891883 /DNA_START=100 /DNA_END=358 /DNA_ORIENTATION=+